jgi:hypothetical protein
MQCAEDVCTHCRCEAANDFLRHAADVARTVVRDIAYAGRR